MALLDAYELAEKLGVSPQWIWRRVRTGELPCFKFARGSTRFDLAEVESWMERNRAGQKVSDSREHSTVP